MKGEWKRLRLADVCSMKSGETITSKSITVSGKYPCYGGNGLRGYAAEFTHKGDHVLVGRQGAQCGNVHFVQGCFYASEHAVVCTAHDYVYPPWLAVALKALNLNRHAESSAQPGLSVAKVLRMKINVPPLPEQTAIAEVLACWDKAIRLYERKLEIKREIKKGLMRKLLAGEWRLPGFSGKWVPARFGEVFEFVKTYAYSREQLTKRGAGRSILNVHYGDLHASYTDILLDVGNEKQIPEIKVGVDVPDDLSCLRDGDLVIADASEDYEGVGACVEIKNVGDRMLIGGLHTMVARDSGGRTIPGYRGYILKEAVVAKTMQQMATGVSVHGLSKTNLSKIAIRLPSPDEQHAIASVLADADKDISCLSSKLTLLRDQKKYLLSKLVTGAIRLPQFREAS